MTGDGQNSHDMIDLNVQLVSIRIIIHIADLAHRVCPSSSIITIVKLKIFCVVLLNIICNSYGLVWISTTLVFVIASLGNCATYLMEKRSVSNSSWSFDVSYINMAAGVVYGYALLVPMVFYFLLQYLGSNVSLVRFWCMWGYSLFIFILSSVSINSIGSWLFSGQVEYIYICT